MYGAMFPHIILMPTMKWKMVPPIRERIESTLHSSDMLLYSTLIGEVLDMIDFGKRKEVKKINVFTLRKISAACMHAHAILLLLGSNKHGIVINEAG
mmetsp:Transcript_36592/g.62296  ORF Transcript_36592/g.62296 Transcript_36592/m.62296 type:complete len:97 (+) Transcript_36592:89-379(+)